MSSLVEVALGMGVILLLIAFFFPSMIAAPTGDIEQTFDMQQSDSVVVTDNLELSLSNVESGDGTVEIALIDLTTGETVQQTINETDTETIDMPDGDVTVTVEAITGGSRAVLTVSYPATYGWEEGAVVIAENMDVVLVLLTFIVVGGLLKAVMK